MKTKVKSKRNLSPDEEISQAVNDLIAGLHRETINIKSEELELQFPELGPYMEINGLICEFVEDLMVQVDLVYKQLNPSLEHPTPAKTNEEKRTATNPVWLMGQVHALSLSCRAIHEAILQNMILPKLKVMASEVSEARKSGTH